MKHEASCMKACRKSPGTGAAELIQRVIKGNETLGEAVNRDDERPALLR